MKIYVAFPPCNHEAPILVTTSESRVNSLLDSNPSLVNEIQIWEDNELYSCLVKKENLVPLHEAFEESWRRIFFGDE